MTATAPQPPLDYRRYLTIEEETGLKHLFWDGEVFAMTGAMPDHNLITANLIAALGASLSGRPCRPYSSDQRVRVSDTRAFYPDITVICGQRQTHPHDAAAVTNPTALFEVLSPSTEAFDRGAKFEALGILASLRTYVLIAQDRPAIQIFERTDDTAEWTVRVVLDGAMEIRSLGVSVDMSAVYDGVEFSTEG